MKCLVMLLCSMSSLAGYFRLWDSVKRAHTVNHQTAGQLITNQHLPNGSLLIYLSVILEICHWHACSIHQTKASPVTVQRNSSVITCICAVNDQQYSCLRAQFQLKAFRLIYCDFFGVGCQSSQPHFYFQVFFFFAGKILCGLWHTVYCIIWNAITRLVIDSAQPHPHKHNHKLSYPW